MAFMDQKRTLPETYYLYKKHNKRKKTCGKKQDSVRRVASSEMPCYLLPFELSGNKNAINQTCNPQQPLVFPVTEARNYVFLNYY